MHLYNTKQTLLRHAHNVYVCRFRTVLTAVKPRLHKRIQLEVLRLWHLHSRIWLLLQKSKEQHGGLKWNFHSLYNAAVNSSAVSSPEWGQYWDSDRRRNASHYQSFIQGAWTASTFAVWSVYSRGTAHPKCYYMPLSYDSIVRTQGRCVLM